MQYIPALAGVGGLNTSASDTQTTGFPSILDGSTGTSYGSGAGGPFVAHTNVPQFADNLTWIKGRHAFKTGVLFRAREYNIFQSIYPRGLYITTAYETANAALQGGYGFASDLLGDPLETLVDLNFQESGQRIKEVGAYFQDDFKVNKQLTLNLGLRWDQFGPATDVHNRLSNLNLTTKKLFFPGNGVSASTINTNHLDFGPRVGFAFSPTQSGNTVIRGGGAISFLPLQVQAAAVTLDYNAPYTYEAIAVDSGNLFGTPGNTLVSNGLHVQMSADPTVVPAGATVTYIPKYQPTPYTEQWSLGVQQKIPHNVGLFEVDYVGTNGIHLAGYQNINQYAPGTSVAASPISPNFGETYGLLNDEQSNYNSLQTKFDRNFSGGLAVTASYTYSRSIDDGSSTTAANANSSNFAQNSFDLAAERGPSDFNHTHRAVVSFVYELPFGSHKRFATGNSFADALIGGWQVNSIILRQSGAPFTIVTTGGDGAINAGVGGSVRPNQVGDPNQGGTVAGNPTCVAPTQVHTAAHWYNPCAFVDPVNAFGNTSRNSITSPNFVNVDASLFRTFPLFYGAKLQFRSEFFNVLNHPNLGLPNATFDTPAGGAIPGQILSAGPGRIIQLALKALF